ncbi:MAG: hypothetical protein JO107_03645 [Hyphomicrobiales bacterium]|nr:hypothetical protein [Hyphomicrobiales bacterium]
MSPARTAAEFGPYVFELTPDEARIAAARAGLRRALEGRLTLSHFAPIAAFVLAMAFIAILTTTALVARRHGEIALLLATGAFMVQRLTTRRRFAAARRASLGEIEALRSAGPLVARLDESGLSLEGPASPARWDFAACREIEDAGGLIYLWPTAGPPAVLPTRVFPTPEEATGLVEFVRGRLLRQLARPPERR